MTGASRVIRSRRVVLPDGMRPASITIMNGVIEAVGKYEVSGAEDLGNLVVMPGLVDTHVHVDEPGRADGEDFAIATQAAAAGGVTTLIDMPLPGNPAPQSVPALEAMIEAARGRCWVDVGFWGALVPNNAGDLRPLWNAGCFGFQCFCAQSGVDGLPVAAHLRQAMTGIASLGGVLLAHVEDPAQSIPGDAENPEKPLERSYAQYLASLPRPAEVAIEQLIHLSRETRCRVHILRLASSRPLSLLAPARNIGVPITVETCPHYLTFAAEEVGDGATEFKCSPPIRESDHRDGLWLGMASQIDLVVSDHSPCPSAMKCKETGDFLSAWPGIASLEIGLAAVWTEARYRDFTITDVARWMCTGPANLAGLGDRKGSIAAGYDADLVIWHPEAGFAVDPGRFRQRQKLTPYTGRRLYGKVQQTILRGHTVELDGRPTGDVMRRGEVSRVA